MIEPTLFPKIQTLSQNRAIQSKSSANITMNTPNLKSSPSNSCLSDYSTKKATVGDKLTLSPRSSSISKSNQKIAMAIRRTNSKSDSCLDSLFCFDSSANRSTASNLRGKDITSELINFQVRKADQPRPVRSSRSESDLTQLSTSSFTFQCKSEKIKAICSFDRKASPTTRTKSSQSLPGISVGLYLPKSKILSSKVNRFPSDTSKESKMPVSKVNRFPSNTSKERRQKLERQISRRKLQDLDICTTSFVTGSRIRRYALPA